MTADGPAPGPDRLVASPDGTPIAVFRSGEGPPLVLVHGTIADHTTFRVVAPRLAERFAVWAIDRRGRGASGDGAAWSIEREFEDVAAVVEAAAAVHDRPVDVVGHSFGGRVGLGAALRTSGLRRLVVYEGAPAPPGAGYRDEALVRRVEAHLAAGEPALAIETFLREVVGMGDEAIGTYRSNPVWPARVSTAPTLLRELRGEASAAVGLDALGGVAIPVLQVLGGASLPVFDAATRALDARLADGRVVVIEGARHAAHHTHPDAFLEAVETFLA